MAPLGKFLPNILDSLVLKSFDLKVDISLNNSSVLPKLNLDYSIFSYTYFEAAIKLLLLLLLYVGYDGKVSTSPPPLDMTWEDFMILLLM